MSAPTLVPVHRAPAVAEPVTAARTPRLGRRALRREQQATLDTPRRDYCLVARAYRTLGRRHRDAGLAHRITERIVENREQQDNEQWHLLITSELVAATGRRQSRLWFGVLPWLMACGYYHVSWLLFVVAPRWSYRLNADFEDHAEHEYALFVAEHPEFETQHHFSRFAAQYGAFDSVADLLRQIGHDERRHKQESEAYLAAGSLYG
ncbi:MULTISPECIES: alternative oxidase [unclassified Pseudonocardia]|jgi:hypothetical protein|uniref:alternative oxidase n=1 Tax=unclassified Pseudonocardia TaxID=2619320 RepID=UPI00095C510D|nr:MULTISPECIES: alternative oxidase [unclassified Pseudonocardia]MBN9100780.1 hypothetical protein [Pseudonocardia sp.]OJY44135.1 MAG: hypothetical protein BGP03_07300 [Pseudonocardia sp. 73-21]